MWETALIVATGFCINLRDEILRPVTDSVRGCAGSGLPIGVGTLGILVV